MDWSLIVFAYNEGPTIEKVLTDCHHFLQSNASKDSEIILVDDGSTDETVEICARLTARIPCLRVIRHEDNKGIGQALRSGYGAVTCTYVCAVPGDGQFDIQELIQIPPFDPSVFYSFFRVEKTGYNWFRNLLTRGNQILNAKLLKVDIKDVNWIKVFRKDQLALAHISLNSSLIETEISYKLIKSGIRLIERPSAYLPRQAGMPKGGGPKTMMQVFREIAGFYLKWK